MRFLLLACLLSLIACAETHEVSNKEPVMPVQKATTDTTTTGEKTVEPNVPTLPKEDSTVTEVSFFAIGDVLFHTPLFKACKEDSSKCNFDYIFAPWKKDIQSADIAAVNQETIFVPREDGYASYPSFGSPEEVGIAEMEAGFDIITHATNHTIDRKASAVDYTIDFWTGKPVLALGIHKTLAGKDSVVVYEKNGIRFSFVNFTYGLNGQKLPSDRPYLVDLLDSNGNWVEMVKKAEASAEVTVAFMHFGTEYVDLPTEEAQTYAELAIDAGADILVCAHPHVIEPYGIYTTKAGNRALVYWSLGNFISNQQDISTNLGGVAKFTVRKVQKENLSRVEVSSASFEGSVTQQEVGNYHAIPLNAYSDSLAERHLLKAKIPELSLKAFEDLFQKNLENAPKCGTENPEKVLPLPIVNFSNVLSDSGKTSP
ncbi:MAG: CapA family protein [Fibrobacter sp.]|nr:CapA family protein [Fibrobacter sp.]